MKAVRIFMRNEGLLCRHNIHTLCVCLYTQDCVFGYTVKNHCVVEHAILQKNEFNILYCLQFHF